MEDESNILEYNEYHRIGFSLFRYNYSYACPFKPVRSPSQVDDLVKSHFR